MLDRLRRRTPDPPGFDPNRIPAKPRETTVDADDGPVRCHAVGSPDGRWTLAYGRRVDGTGSVAFRLRDGEIVDRFEATRPAAGAVGDDGTVALVERLGSNTTATRLRAFVDGRETLVRTVDATVSGVVVAPDGELVAVTTRRPDASVHAYDPGTGEVAWTVTPRRATPLSLGFHADGDRSLLYVAREPRDDPYLAIDADGEVVWGSERYRSTQPFSARVRGWFDRGE